MPLRATRFHTFVGTFRCGFGTHRARHEYRKAIQAGAHILTVPPKFFPQMCAHPKTDEAVGQFMTEFRAWEQSVQASQLKRAA